MCSILPLNLARKPSERLLGALERICNLARSNSDACARVVWIEMNDTTIRFSTFPRTEPPPAFVEDLVNAFRQHESEIATEINDKGLRSNDVLAVRSTVKKLSVLLSLLGLLLFLATPALGDTRGGVVDSK